MATPAAQTLAHTLATCSSPYLHFFKANGALLLTGQLLRRRIPEAVAEQVLEATVAEVSAHALYQAPGGKAHVQEQHGVDQLQLQAVKPPAFRRSGERVWWGRGCGDQGVV